MSGRHLFTFGFETPTDFHRNKEHGWDDESSTALWILADSAADALQWGQILAQDYVSWLFRDEQGARYSWAEAGFANWIETDARRLSEAGACEALPSVTVGELPDFTTMG